MVIYNLELGPEGELQLQQEEDVGTDVVDDLSSSGDGANTASELGGYIVVRPPEAEAFALPVRAGAQVNMDTLEQAYPTGTSFERLSSDEFPDVPIVMSSAALYENVRRLRQGELEQIIDDMLARAQKRFCSMSIRPTEVTIGADVRIGIGTQGGVQFEATWATAELCP